MRVWKIAHEMLDTKLLKNWSPMICAEKALHGGVDIWDYVKTYAFNNFVYF